MTNNSDANEVLAKFMGARLKEARRSRDITQVQAASSLDLTHSAIGQWERGETLPGLINLIKIAEIYSASLDRLIWGVEHDLELRLRQLPDKYRDQLLKQVREQLEFFEKMAADMPPGERTARVGKNTDPIRWGNILRAT